MIVALGFGPPRQESGRRVRAARLTARSTIPVSALCVVANGIREHLRELLDLPVEIALGDATLLGDAARAMLVERMHCFLTPGRTSDVVLFVSEDDARRLLAFALGGKPIERDLSPLERSALARLVDGLARFFDPLCAERYAPVRAIDPHLAARCASYVDLRIGPPVDAMLGIGVMREPPECVGGPTIRPEQLLAVTCEVRAEIARGTLSAARLACLAPGEIVRMDTKVGAEAALKVAELVIARGRGGLVVDEDAARTAFAVDSV